VAVSVIVLPSGAPKWRKDLSMFHTLVCKRGVAHRNTRLAFVLDLLGVKVYNTKGDSPPTDKPVKTEFSNHP